MKKGSWGVLLALLCVTALAQTPGPFTGARVTEADVAAALEKAKAENKILMVEFGANWCLDCIVLAENLDKGETKDYFRQHFVVLRVDVGEFNRNLEIPEAVGVKLNAIPTAAFFAPDGDRIGATNNMELEPSRRYGTTQILAFLKEVAERRRITNPAQFK